MYENKDLDLWIAKNVFNIDATVETVIPYSSSMEYSHLIRKAMTEKGYSSEDTYSDLGWGNKDGQPVFGYSIWFSLWPKDENGKILGYKHVGIGSDSDPSQFARAVCIAAKGVITNPTKG